MKPKGKMMQWKGNCWKRVEMSRVFLRVHGFISETENRKIEDRISKWLSQHGYSRGDKTS